MNKTQQRTNGFTIIEILVVLVIIIILAGMVFKMMGHAGTKNEQAYTRSVLEKVSHALEEFRATYGKYPPVPYYPGVDPEQPSEYEYPVSSMMTDSLAQQLKNDKKLVWSASRVFTFGLISFLFPRYTGAAEGSPEVFVGGPSKNTYDPTETINQWSDYNIRDASYHPWDLGLDLEASRRTMPYLGAALVPNDEEDKKKYPWKVYKISEYGLVEKDWVARSYGNVSYTNFYLHIDDGWERQIRYQSRPPYDTYKLWSVGPDGKNDTGDDIVAGKE